jgi:hypothetical protein
MYTFLILFCVSTVAYGVLWHFGSSERHSENPFRPGIRSGSQASTDKANTTKPHPGDRG